VSICRTLSSQRAKGHGRCDREDKVAIAKVKEMLRQWRENHMFKVVEMQDPRTCKEVPFVVLDQLAN
jgi:hypothetical protein